ncbi:hypothetical protein [Runella slithyformis]|uniref:Outer membrane protein beta-barrel domain-containing protein n=1 Tax=Runella slithyformis (strain ATCC 29530 / DSM 19594 / LMG 11500 / NCIMB 11436 / LSU 4) TaxID=761193 RepID=A0A7U3ZPM7_RUNSL|nr:hypothetical protein [Runella slithyformis]AEI51050.1 hypothetical protein Runsl_4732 [Runella slithyformis DSM 19594]
MKPSPLQLLPLIALFYSTLVLGQTAPTMSLYLKNGSVIHGKLKQESPVYRIETYDKSQWVFQPTEVEKVIPHKALNPNIRYRDKGFVHYTELGPLAMSNRASNGVTTSAFSFQTTNGYKFNQWLYTGVGVGADLYAVQTFVPVVLCIRGDFSQKGDKIPYYFLEGGYGFNATSNDLDNLRFGGGSTFAGGIGLRILFSNTTGFVIGAGYRFQRSTVTQLNRETIEDFNRLTLRAGFTF